MNDQRLIVGFLRANPRIGTFPHLLVRAGTATLESVAEALHSPLGLWGERPLYRADGSPYLEPADSKITRDFQLWKLPLNHEYLLGRATVGPDPQFFMFISAETPVEVLERTYEHFDNASDSSRWFGDHIEWVCEWLSGLHWALIPLEGEILWSIFVTSPEHRGLLAVVKNAFRKQRIPTAHLERKEDEEFRWVDDAHDQETP